MQIKRGRKRDDSVRLSILAAILELVAQGNSFARISVEQLARQAGVSKTTIYKWWPGKEDIFCEAFLLHASETLPVLEYDAGNQRDFYAQFILRTLEMRKFHRAPIARVMIGLALEHPDIAKQLYEQHQQPRFQAMRKIFADWFTDHTTQEDITFFLKMSFSLIYNFSAANSDDEVVTLIRRLFRTVFPYYAELDLNHP
ncbi:TetR/AcrR family transcriptional regulator [Salmonella enterica]|nr:TetR/AcrR family transcriptional regulator [Salmonella enterica]ECJ5918002.1 TetR/AcrR family transcriptional regulator [Salmonella enterica subsp. salamae]EAN4947309.1 TetR/AcrR family transcriptional regulator [Salmonella enterica]EAX8456495.1 TetR/AcrR family transcriptional regulator [Salmonella enterica]EAX8554164.1 TetR/AcrR family transcriptional regulator [Salmonella enterica]